MVSIKVCWKSSGKPARGQRVSLGFDSMLRGVTSDEYSDDDGNAHFDADPGSGEVYVNGSTVHKGRLSGRVVVYI